MGLCAAGEPRKQKSVVPIQTSLSQPCPHNDAVAHSSSQPLWCLSPPCLRAGERRLLPVGGRGDGWLTQKAGKGWEGDARGGPDHRGLDGKIPE